MRIDSYYIPVAESGLAGAVGETTALFGLTAAGFCADENALAGLPAGAIIISSQVREQEGIVATAVRYRQAGGTQTSRQAEGAIAADEVRGEAIKRLVRLNLLAILTGLIGREPGPWGILRGVRPTKLVHRMLDRGLDFAAAQERLQTRYGVSPAKAALLCEIAGRQRPFLPPPGRSGRLVAVYVGVPYCPSRCLYCSFPSQVLPDNEARVEAFMAALLADIEATAGLMARFGLAAESVYVGGGTPTSLGERHFSHLLAAVSRRLIGPATCEFTVEAGRPDSITDGKIAALATHGVNRVSVNPQTMQEKTLKLIGRNHTVHDIIVMFRKMRAAAIPVINMDIIAGLPGESEADMADTLRQLADLAPDNLTVHTLARKRGSRLADDPGRVQLPDEAATVKMVELAAVAARAAGLAPYYLYRQKYMAGNLENVGYAKPGQEGIYNIQIMEERQTVIGIGPAAATKAVWDNFRLTSCYNPKDVATYLNNHASYMERREQLIAGLFAT